MTPRHQIAVAFPVNEEDRQLLREIAPDVPLPGFYEGATLSKCEECGMALSVGPRTTARLQAEPGLHLLCPLCAAQDVRESGARATFDNLGGPKNPEKR